ncbi:MAG: response regulator [Rhodospirillales bacterium]|jgi:DNA-binding NarL/FixJ family response regulator|nr:response regulator [Rhodospirillales bacterium]
MTGTEFARELLALRRNLSVIICGGYSETVDQAGADALGVRALITKPVGGERMDKIVREVFDEKTSG